MKFLKYIIILTLIAMLSGCTTAYNEKIEKKDEVPLNTSEKVVVNSESENEIVNWKMNL